MWSDNESDRDLLGFHHLQSAVLSIIHNEALLPTTIGIYGDWGSGKSSLLKRIKAELEKEDGIVVLQFNGWIFEGYEGAKTALMGTVLEELLEHKTFLNRASENAQKLARKLLRRVNWLKLAGGAAKLTAAFHLPGPWSAGLGMSGGTDLVAAGAQLLERAKGLKGEDLKEYLKDEEKEEEEREVRRSIREFRADFEKLLEESSIRTLVIIIDDLDRCSPETIIPTLEAIKLFLFVKNTAFIIGADEELVKYAVRWRFPELPGDRREVGRDYLEKLIQFPIRIPSLGRAEVESYIGLLFASLSGLSNEDLSRACDAVTAASSESLAVPCFNLEAAQQLFPDMNPSLKEGLALAERIAPVLGTIMNGNPRQCKRFLNTLLLRRHMAKSRGIELQQRVLVKLMLLEYFKTEFFRRLAQIQAEQEGRPRELQRLEQLARKDKTAGDSSEEAPKSGATSKKPTSSRQIELPTEFGLWLSDPWTLEWLRLEPPLFAEDLRPYFFFSRDRLGVLDAGAQRLSVPAKNVLNKILHESEAVRLSGYSEGERLSGADAAAVFEALAGRVRQEEDLSADPSTLGTLFEWADRRTELRSQVILLLRSLPEPDLPVWTVTKLTLLAQGTEIEDHAAELIRSWSETASNAPLAAAARTELSKRSTRKPIRRPQG